MKKFAGILCAAAMSLSMVCTAFANPSIVDVTIEAQDVVVSAETAAIIPEGKKLVVKEAAPENYESKEAAEVVTKLNDPATTITVKEMLDILKVDTTQEIKTVGGKVIDPTKYEPIAKFADLVLTDDTTVEYDINGEVKAVTATVKVEALKDVENIDDVVLMQIDSKSTDVHFIEIAEDDYVPATGEITVTFPCLGPFTALESAE